MTASIDVVAVSPPEPVRPAAARLTPTQWLRRNLFPNVVNGILTIACALVLGWIAYRIARFVFATTDWEVVRRNLRLFVIGRFPADEVWRLWCALYLVAAAAGLVAGTTGQVVEEVSDASLAPARLDRTAADRARAAARFWPLAAAAVAILVHTRTPTPTLLTVVAVVVLTMARFGGRHLPRTLRRLGWLGATALVVGALVVITGFGGVGWDSWGGLQLTVVVTIVGIVLAFPAGILLALGRRSSLPAIRWLSIAYIELFRGVPLITLLLMGQFVIFFMFPTYMTPPGLLVRALIAIVLFESAYLAEVVRGGLQSVPRGQVEAAQAIGLGPMKQLRLVVLPQALRAVIPAIVGQFISLYKDTSLLSVIALFELLRVAQVVTTQPDFLGQGLDAVTLTFVGFLYWAGCYTMSRESRRIERRLGLGLR